MSRAFIVLYFLILLVTLMVTTKTVQGPWLFLFRAFFPNWKFYHSLGWQPQLYVRTRRQMQSPDELEGKTLLWTPWSPHSLIYPRAKRNFFNLFHNPNVNIALAHQNLVEHLANDLQALHEHQNAHDLVSYKLVNRFVQYSIDLQFKDKQLTSSTEIGALEYQFEVRLKLNSPQIKEKLIQAHHQSTAHKSLLSPVDSPVMGDSSKNNDQFNQDMPLDVHILMISPVMRMQLFACDGASDDSPLQNKGGQS